MGVYAIVPGRQEETLKQVAEAHATGKPVIGYLQLLNSPDMSAAWIAEMKREIRFRQDMVSKQLRAHMLPHLQPNMTSIGLGGKAAGIARNLRRRTNGSATAA